MTTAEPEDAMTIVSPPTAATAAAAARPDVVVGAPPKLEMRDVNIYYGNKRAVRGVDLAIPPNAVTAFIGPSGCGKSTILRCFDRMNDLIPGARVEGKIVLNGEDMYGDGVLPVEVRRRVGLVFQRPNPFPMTIYDNVAYGPRRHGQNDKKV